MKKIILTITFLCCLGLTSNAQEVQKNYINYQGVANDASGNAIANTVVNIQLALKLGSTTAVASYIENHTVTTTAKGLFNLQIGNGTLVSGNYNTIVWGNDAVFLTISLNGAELGTTELVAVPYALSSGDNQWNVTGNDIENKNTGKVTITNNLEVSSTLKLENGVAINEFSTDETLSSNSDVIVPTEKAIKAYVDTNGSSGLETLNEGNGNGWRLKGRSPSTYGNIGSQAVDFSLSLSPSSTYGATGSAAAAFGLFTTASGGSSFVSGFYAVASGDTATAIGNDVLASGNVSVALGNNSIASGDNSIATGTNTTATSFSEVAIGANNTDYMPNSATSWNTNDRLFVVGNGASSTTRNDAFTIYKNGNAKFDEGVEIGTTLTLENGSAINEFSTDGTLSGNSDSVVPTEQAVRAFVESNESTGLEALDEGNGIGWRLKGINANNYGAIGLDALDFSISSSTSGTSGATGENAVAFGRNTTASGTRSVATGVSSTASGVNSIAIGTASEASGVASSAIGSNVIASGQYATALGRGTLSRSYAEVAIGSYNTDYTPDATTFWDSSDKVFVLGNGTSDSNRSDALTVYKNGNMEISGELTRAATSTADMIPIAYGTVSSSGATIYGTGNFTVTRDNTIYTISVDGESMGINNTTSSVTPYSSNSPAVITVSYTGGDLIVRPFSVGGTAITKSFQFVIYKL